MAWTIEYTATALNQLRRLDRSIALPIIDFMDHRIAVRESPRDQGRALTGLLGGLRRYRVGNHRVNCEIQDDSRRIVIVRLGSRADVYR